MKIRRITAYQVDLPLREGRYNWSGGKSVAVFDSTIVRIETEDGLVGHGEVCPLGPFYLPAYGSLRELESPNWAPICSDTIRRNSPGSIA